MIRLGDLNPGDIVEFIDPATSQFNVGTFVRTVKRRTGDKGTDIIVLGSLGHKITIRDQNIRLVRTAHHLQKGGTMINVEIGDSRKLLSKYPDNSFDCVFTSPPFKDEDVDGDYWDFYNAVFNDILRVSSKLAVIIHSATKMNEIVARYPPKRTLIWSKGITQASYRYNPIFVYQKTDNYKVNKYLWCDTFGIPSISGKDKSHVYQDPELLYFTILKMFKGIKTVLDPFAGSGTTGRACRKLDIDCTLLEIVSDYEPLIKDHAMINYPNIGIFENKNAGGVPS